MWELMKTVYIWISQQATTANEAVGEIIPQPLFSIHICGFSS